jgi:hypothetical protein
MTSKKKKRRQKEVFTSRTRLSGGVEIPPQDINHEQTRERTNLPYKMVEGAVIQERGKKILSKVEIPMNYPKEPNFPSIPPSDLRAYVDTDFERSALENMLGTNPGKAWVPIEPGGTKVAGYFDSDFNFRLDSGVPFSDLPTFEFGDREIVPEFEFPSVGDPTKIYLTDLETLEDVFESASIRAEKLNRDTSLEYAKEMIHYENEVKLVEKSTAEALETSSRTGLSLARLGALLDLSEIIDSAATAFIEPLPEWISMIPFGPMFTVIGSKLEDVIYNNPETKVFPTIAAASPETLAERAEVFTSPGRPDNFWAGAAYVFPL